MTTRAEVIQRHERVLAIVLELDIDICGRDFGVAPCTGTGEPCYKCFATCKSKPAYLKQTKTYRYGLRGQPVPIGVTVRPYLADIPNTAPTESSSDKGLARRSDTTIELVDDACADIDDPYRALRSKPAGPSYWARWIPRHPNAVGRQARIRSGFVTQPFTWAAFEATALTELYVIDQVDGQDDAGGVRFTLTDMVKLLDRAVWPPVTSGKLQADFEATSYVGTVVSATPNSVTLPTSGDNPASAVDGAYSGQEAWIYAGVGAGQRQPVAGYVGATRTLTFASNWAVTPDGSSAIEISPLSMSVGADKADQYPAPGYVRVKDEIVRYVSNTAGVLAWPDSSYREQDGTPRASAKTGDQVQRVAVWIDTPPATVLRDLFNAGGMADAYLDLAELAAEATQWLSIGANVTRYLHKPEQISTLVGELLRYRNLTSWWDAVAQKQRFRAAMPRLSTSVPTLTDAGGLIRGKTAIARKDAERITQAGVFFGLRFATADVGKETNYLRGEAAIDTDAESPNEFGTVRQDITLTPWMSAQNATYARILMIRRLARRRNAPVRVKFHVDPRDEVQVADLVNLVTARYTGPDGHPKTVQVRVVRVDREHKHLAVEAEVAGFGRRYGFIAPPGLPDYALASDAQRAWAFIANPATQSMSSGDEPYLII